MKLLFRAVLLLGIPLAAQEIQFTQVAAGITAPSDIQNAGDGSGRLFLVQQNGIIKILRNGVVLAQPFLDITSKTRLDGERGLLGLAFAPGYAQSGRFYVDYTDLNGNTVIAQYHVSSNPDVADAASEVALLHIDQPFPNHNGGQVRFGPDGYLYIAMGDGGSGGDPLGNGQNLGTLLGKLLRVDVESAPGQVRIPPDNPFINTPGAKPEIWAYGLRNPWRFSFDSATHDLWIGDVGQAAYEEIDLQPASSHGGENYGWNRMEGLHCYQAGCSQQGLTLPIWEYTHDNGCAITGGFVYRGSAAPGLRGTYIYGDYCSGIIWGLTRAGSTSANRTLASSGFMITTFGVDEAGELYVADAPTGIVRRIGQTTCTYQLSGTFIAIPQQGGTRTVAVRAPNGCAWTASSDMSWLTISSGISRSGNGGVTFSAPPNSNDSARSAVLTIAGQPFNVTQVGTQGLGFFPVAGCRAVDTRSTQGKTGLFGPPAVLPYQDRDVRMADSGCELPDTAQAYSLNFTVVPHGPLSFLSTWPTGESYPGVSTLNSPDGSVVANAGIISAGIDGAIRVVAGGATDLIIDANGYFAPPTGTDLAFYAVTPCRIADTRNDQGRVGAAGPPALEAYKTRDFSIAGACGIPASAKAYSLNITVVPHGPLDFLSTWPAGQPYPGVSTLNSPDGSIIANAAIVPAGTDGSITVAPGNPTDFILDVNGYFAPGGGQGALHFFPLTPCRVVDTRPDQGKTGAFGPPALQAYSTRDVPVMTSNCGVPPTAAAYSLNVTVVPEGPLDFLSVWPADQPYPGVSTLNSPKGTTVANAAIVPAGANAAISVVAGNPTHFIIDINGYFAP